MAATSFFQSKRICVTGAAGSFGGAAISHLLQSAAAEIVAVDSDENGLFELGVRYGRRITRRYCDVRDRRALMRMFEGIDVVIHAAALKHVAVCESSPMDAVRTNVLGTMNVIDATRDCGVGHMLLTSSDKAVHPVSSMGSTKLLCERLMTSASHEGSGPRFVTVRFGNVIGTRGSVVPIFTEQIQQGRAVTVRDPRMTRFFMSLQDAVALVLGALAIGRGGEIFIMKMPVIRILDLAEVMIEMLARNPSSVETIVSGAEPGEKLHEELMSDQEASHAIETATSFVLLPHGAITAESARTYGGRVYDSSGGSYTSGGQVPMQKSEIAEYLRLTRTPEPSPLLVEKMACI